MVPPDSTGIPRAPAYSGTQPVDVLGFRIRDSHPLRSAVPGAFRYPFHLPSSGPTTPARLTPRRFRLLPVRSPLLGESHLISLPPGTEMFQFPGLAPPPKGRRRGMTPARLPHSDTPGSMLACSSPRLFAACHVLLRRLVPRHPPCALNRLTHKLPKPPRSRTPAFTQMAQSLARPPKAPYSFLTPPPLT